MGQHHMQVWGEARSAPTPASLDSLLQDAHLSTILLDCLKGKDDALQTATARLLGPPLLPSPYLTSCDDRDTVTYTS